MSDTNDETARRLAEEGSRLTTSELGDVEQHLRLRAAVVYETVRQEGEEELGRTPSSLWWSGIAAGLSIGFSVVAEGLLRAHLPDAPWRPLIENLGYSVGFLIVILARQQLFTENTLTAVLPLVASPSRMTAWRTARLWAIVFAANMVGTCIFALALSTDLFFTPEAHAAFRDLARHLMELSPTEAILRGIVAGWLIATLVWLLPIVEHAAIWVIVLITYLIALGDLAHVIAGSVEVFLLVADGEISVLQASGFIAPALLGNILGGSALFAILAYAQVREEI